MLGWKTVLDNRRAVYGWLLALIVPTLLVGGWLGVTSHVAQHTNRLKVAVVNQDSGAKYQGKNQNIGAQLSQGLMAQKQLDFVSVNTVKQARQKLEQKQVSAVLVWPENTTQRLSEFKHSGKPIVVQQYIDSGRNAFATEQIQRRLTNIVTGLSEQLLMGNTGASTLENLVKQSGQLQDEANDLQTNLRAVGRNLDTDKAADLQKDATDTANDLAQYSSALNAAVASDDKEKMSELATKINTLSYKMQTDIVSSIAGIATSLDDTKMLSSQDSVIQAGAKTIADGQNGIQKSLKTMLGQQADNQDANGTNQMIAMHTVDQRPIKQSGQVTLPTITAIALTIQAILFGIILRVSHVKAETLALEQWWQTFRVVGLLSLISAVVMGALPLLWHISLENIWLLMGINVISLWLLTSIVWLFKHYLGQIGWWLATVLLTIQTFMATDLYHLAILDKPFQLLHQLLPLHQIQSAIQSAVFGGEVTNDILIVIIWLLVLTMLIVISYRVHQRAVWNKTLATDAS